jgi:GNAT-family acetyltransferase (TIGR03103 family)
MSGRGDDNQGKGPGESVGSRLASMISLRNWGPPPEGMPDELLRDVTVDCGWGRLIFGQTFADHEHLLRELRRERAGQRDVALYIRDPQVVLAQSPQELFIDPSYTLRLALDRDFEAPGSGLEIRPFERGDDIEVINRIYLSRGMVPVEPGFARQVLERNDLSLLLACDPGNGNVLGCVTGVDHRIAFEDPDQGSSLWALAVDPQCQVPGAGRALVLALAQRFRDAGRAFMDLSVMHDNRGALALYEQLGFEQVPVYCVKKKNAINEPLFTGPQPTRGLNPYARIITDEAMRRGIAVEVVDTESGLFRLSLGGRTVNCRESLTDATSAVALSRCDDKALTHRLLRAAGVRVPAQAELSRVEEVIAFAERHGPLVIKPASGEQGEGVFVDLRTEADLRNAFDRCKVLSDRVLVEEYVRGQDLRVIVIAGEVVAAALRRPPVITGTGRHSVSKLIEKLSRRRAAATGGESEIPLDEESLRCVREAGYDLDEILPYGERLTVRKTANLHTGGTLHDVTAKLSPELAAAAVEAAEALEIPVVGLDFIVQRPDRGEYVIIEANERPGLANHEPQPTAEKLIDFLFPSTTLTSMPSR